MRTRPHFSTSLLIPVVVLVSFLGIEAEHASGDRAQALCDEQPVLVIGAGISGLAAARQLEADGCLVQVIEARNRTGGRIHTTDGNMELGAHWIEGYPGNVLTDLVHEIGLDLVTLPGTSRVDGGRDLLTLYYQNGTKVSDRVKDEAFENFDKLEDKAEESKPSSTATMESVLRDADSSLKFDVSLNQEQRKALDWMTKAAFLLDYGADTDEISAQGYFGTPDAAKGVAAIRQGFSKVTDYLAKGLNISLNAEVTRIVYSELGVTIETADGRKFKGLCALITVPLGVLKDGRIKFQPPLPESKVKAISGIGFGLEDKCLMTFPKPFWNENTTKYSVGFLDEKGSSLGYGIFFNNVYENRTDGGATLEFFVGGTPALQIELEAQGDDKIKARVLKALRAVYGDKVPDPISTHVTRWNKDTYALGSYSFNKVPFNPDFRGDLAESMGGLQQAVSVETRQDRLFWAGEATSTDQYQSTHGAYSEGLRAAEEINVQWGIGPSGLRQLKWILAVVLVPLLIGLFVAAFVMHIRKKRQASAGGDRAKGNKYERVG